MLDNVDPDAVVQRYSVKKVFSCIFCEIFKNTLFIE